MVLYGCFLRTMNEVRRHTKLTSLFVNQAKRGLRQLPTMVQQTRVERGIGPCQPPLCLNQAQADIRGYTPEKMFAE
jgi:hypothetical protein